MSEVSLIDVRAQVMTYDESTKKWTPSGSGEPSLSKVQLFMHQQNSTYRVVARKLIDKEVVINCALVKGMRYNRATATFHQWRDTRQVYGLNFANGVDASTFGNAVQEALEGTGQRLSITTSDVNGDTQQLEREREERQKLLEEQREHERLARIKEAEEEAEKRRVAEDKVRKEREEKVRLDQERRDQEALQKRLAQQRKKEEDDELQRVTEQERLLEQQVAEKQRELDAMRAMEKKVQEEMEHKAKSSPRGTPNKVAAYEEDVGPTATVANTFGVQLKTQSAVKTDISPVHSIGPKPVVLQYEDQIQNDVELPEPPRTPSPVYNIPSPPPDIPVSFNIAGASGNKPKVTTQTSSSAPINKNRAGSQKGGQNNLMDEIQKRFESMKQRSNVPKDDGNSNPNPTSPYMPNRNLSPSSTLTKHSSTPTAVSVEKKELPKQESIFKNKQPAKSEITSKDLQTLKAEIMRDIKVELERTKQEILTEIRKELSKK